MGHFPPSGTVRALLLTDVVDSTKLAEELGDAEMAALWARHDRLARDLLPEHGGREIDKTDGFLMLFDRAAGAVAYTVAYHRGLRELGIAARAGIHVGPVILTENRASDVARGAKPLEVDGIAKPTAARVMSVAMGGQTLLTREALDALGPTPLRVGSHGHWRMKGVAEPLELFEVGDADAPMTPPPDGAKVYRVVERAGVWLPVRECRHHLPAERDAFVGRATDLRALADLLVRSRLASVLGLGGTGKTRLVTRFGWTWLGDFPGGVWFCDLSEARSAEDVCHAVASALSVPLAGREDPSLQLGHAIAGRGECLIVLDNFEQVVREAPRTLGRWLDRAREARFVVTTREVLGLPGESVLALAPLTEDEAIELFVARARQARQDFVPDDEASIRALVQLLDNLPLAIELAAARVRVMPPKTLLQRMSERFRLLSSSGGRHTRQATLRATFDWGWDLLTEDERAALAQLSVFEGGFSLEAAEAVLALSEMWATDAVQALVDRSWIRPRGEDRFDLLMSVREYAAEKLEAAGARADTEARHGAWFARLGEDEAIEALSTHGGVARQRALRTDLENVVAACQRAVARGDADRAVPTLLAAAAVLDLTGPAAVLVGLAGAVRGLALPPRGVVLVEGTLGNALAVLGRWAEARAYHEGTLTLARAIGDARLEARCLFRLGALYRVEGRQAEARACNEEALAIYRRVGARRAAGGVLANLGGLYRDQGRPDEALACHEQAIAIAREVGNRRTEGLTLGNLGSLHREQGRLEEARACLEQALAIHREVGNRRHEGGVLGSLGTLHDALGQPEEARAWHAQALATHREVGDRGAEGVALGNLGTLLLEQGQLEAARDLLERALSVHRELRYGYGQGYWLRALARIEAATGSDGWRALADEAVAVSAPYPGVHAEVLAVRARLRLDAGDLAGARADVDAARAFARTGRAAVMVALADARTSHAEGRAEAARAALREGQGLAASAHEGPASALGRELAELQGLLDRDDG